MSTLRSTRVGAERPGHLVVLVLRLAPDAIAAGALAGEVEAVSDGRRATVRSMEDVLAFAHEVSQATTR